MCSNLIGMEANEHNFPPPPFRQPFAPVYFDPPPQPQQPVVAPPPPLSTIIDNLGNQYVLTPHGYVPVFTSQYSPSHTTPPTSVFEKTVQQSEDSSLEETVPHDPLDLRLITLIEQLKNNDAVDLSEITGLQLEIAQNLRQHAKNKKDDRKGVLRSYLKLAGFDPTACLDEREVASNGNKVKVTQSLRVLFKQLEEQPSLSSNQEGMVLSSRTPSPSPSEESSTSIDSPAPQQHESPLMPTIDDLETLESPNLPAQNKVPKKRYGQRGRKQPSKSKQAPAFEITEPEPVNNGNAGQLPSLKMVTRHSWKGVADAIKPVANLRKRLLKDGKPTQALFDEIRWHENDLCNSSEGATILGTIGQLIIEENEIENDQIDIGISYLDKALQTGQLSQDTKSKLRKIKKNSAKQRELFLQRKKEEAAEAGRIEALARDKMQDENDEASSSPKPSPRPQDGSQDENEPSSQIGEPSNDTSEQLKAEAALSAKKKKKKKKKKKPQEVKPTDGNSLLQHITNWLNFTVPVSAPADGESFKATDEADEALVAKEKLEQASKYIQAGQLKEAIALLKDVAAMNPEVCAAAPDIALKIGYLYDPNSGNNYPDINKDRAIAQSLYDNAGDAAKWNNALLLLQDGSIDAAIHLLESEKGAASEFYSDALWCRAIASLKENPDHKRSIELLCTLSEACGGPSEKFKDAQFELFDQWVDTTITEILTEHQKLFYKGHKAEAKEVMKRNAELVGLVGRLYLEGSEQWQERGKKGWCACYKSHTHNPNTCAYRSAYQLIVAAANNESNAAYLFLGNTHFGGESILHRYNHIAEAYAHFNTLTSAQQNELTRINERYAFEGYLMPLTTRIMGACEDSNDPHGEQFIQKLEENFLPLMIRATEGVSIEGLQKQLDHETFKKWAEKSWAIKAVQIANQIVLEILQTSANEGMTDSVLIKCEELEALAKQHKQVKVMLPSAYAQIGKRALDHAKKIQSGQQKLLKILDDIIAEDYLKRAAEAENEDGMLYYARFLEEVKGKKDEARILRTKLMRKQGEQELAAINHLFWACKNKADLAEAKRLRNLYEQRSQERYEASRHLVALQEMDKQLAILKGGGKRIAFVQAKKRNDEEGFKMAGNIISLTNSFEHFEKARGFAAEGYPAKAIEKLFEATTRKRLFALFERQAKEVSMNQWCDYQALMKDLEADRDKLSGASVRKLDEIYKRKQEYDKIEQTLREWRTSESVKVQLDQYEKENKDVQRALFITSIFPSLDGIFGLGKLTKMFPELKRGGVVEPPSDIVLTGIKELVRKYCLQKGQEYTQRRQEVDNEVDLTLMVR